MNRQLFNIKLAAAAVLMATILGVTTFQSQAAEPEKPEADKAYILKKAPQRASEVAALRKDAKDQQEIVVVGRVGGRTNPWVKGTAAFSIVDRSLKACSEIPGDTCETPWDFCCEADLPKSTLLVLVHDADGKLVKKDARELLGVKELDTVFIQGKAKRDKTGNVSIVASKFYVATAKEAKEAKESAKEKKEASAEKKETAK